MPHPAPYLMNARDADELEALLFDENDRCDMVWLRAARAPEQAWRELLGRLDDHWPVSLASAATDPVVLSLVSTDEFITDDEAPYFTGYVAAQNRYTPVPVLRRLAARPHIGSRRAVALNPSTPWDLLEQLAADDEDELREAVARRFDFWFHAQDKYHRVQRELAEYAARRERRAAVRAARDAFRRNAKRTAKADPAGAPRRPRLP
jgi:hypothetical protein